MRGNAQSSVRGEERRVMTLALSRGGAVFSRSFVYRRPATRLLTTVSAALCIYPVWLGFRWAVLRATWTLPVGASASCQAGGPSGAAGR